MGLGSGPNRSTARLSVADPTNCDPDQSAAHTSISRGMSMSDPLAAAASLLRRGRPPLDSSEPWYVHRDIARGRSFAQVWFLTRGCTWDRRGECVMCNYGHGAAVSDDDMVRYARAAIAAAGPVDELFVSPSGNLLDPLEVPNGALGRILQSVAASPSPNVSFETRPETLRAPIVKEVVRRLPRKAIRVGIGLESADPWVRRYCLGKGGTVDAVAASIQLLRSVGIGSYVNIALGAPFLTAQEAIADARNSVVWANVHGAELAVIFPLHVKEHTVLEHLWSHGRYTVPSLWQVVDTISSLPASVARSTQVAWYRPLPDAKAVLASPDGCELCRRSLLEALDDFRSSGDPGSLRSVDARSCGCRSVPEPQISSSRKARIETAYALLQDELGLVYPLGGSRSRDHRASGETIRRSLTIRPSPPVK